MTLLDRIETIFQREIEDVEKKNFDRGWKYGCHYGTFLTLMGVLAGTLLSLGSLLREKASASLTTNGTQCLTVWPQESCSAYCNSPTFLR